MNLFFAFIAFFLSLILFGGAGSYQPYVAPGWEQVTTNGIEGVIVAEHDASGLAPNADGYWMPTSDDVAAAEATIEESQGRLDHFRQYGGYLEDGQRLIAINGYCASFDDYDLYQTVVGVDDGGDCFFSASYNVDTATLEYFAFNGYG
jgi:hypothetical protein